jgi:5-methylcytosine-specific restriction protein B
MSSANEVRKFARQKYVEPALQRRERKIQIRAGDVHKQLTLKNRVPLVCQALESEIFLKENNLVLETKEGPPSGLSTSVVFTYRVVDEAAGSSSVVIEPTASAANPSTRFLGLLQLKGVGKEVFASLGGGERFIRSEREAFAKAIEKQDRERGLL